MAARRALTVLLLALLVPCALPAQNVGRIRPIIPLENLSDTTTLRDVFERCAEASGGHDEFERLSTRVIAATVVTDLAWDPPIHEVDTLTVYVKAPDSYLMVHRTPGGVLLEGGLHGSLWKREPDGTVSVVDEHDLHGAWLTDVRFFANLAEHFPDAELLGVDVIDGVHSYVVARDDQPIHNTYFDIETGRLTRLGFHTHFLEYVRTDGIIFPRRVIYGRKGGSTTFLIEEIHHNIPLDDVLFAPPTTR